jgi:hypothetical protein
MSLAATERSPLGASAVSSSNVAATVRAVSHLAIVVASPAGCESDSSLAVAASWTAAIWRISRLASTSDELEACSRAVSRLSLAVS